MNPKDNATINLAEQLARPVAQPATATALLDPEQDEIQTPSAELEPEQEPVYVEQPQPGAAPGDDSYILDPLSTAESLIDAIDGVQSLALPWLRKLNVFTKKELEVLDQLDTTGSTIYTPADSIEALVFAKYKRHEQIIEKIPFSDRERKGLVNATARYVEQTDMKLTPIQALIASFSGVMLKRAQLVVLE